jgi:rsbT co-antagonist protein RsbR
MLVLFASEYAQAVTENKRLMAEREETMARQRAAVAELSTPIIDIWDDVITLPIVGIVDTQRSVEMTEKLLARIAEKRARHVIVDLTGVEVVDTLTADHLVKMIRAAQMLGSTCLVTGISPAIAQTLVELDVQLDGVPTLRSLKEGLKACLKSLADGRNP